MSTRGTTIDLTITTDPDAPWTESVPAAIERLRQVAIEHQSREEECGDHTRERCRCGAPDFTPGWYDRPREERVTLEHDFRWERHFIEVWNATVAEIAAEAKASKRKGGKR